MKPPIVRPVSWTGVIVQLAVIAIFSAVIALLFRIRDYPLAIFFGAVTQSVLSRVARATFASDHRSGITLFRASKFSEAAPHFEASYAAFSRRPWLDRFRWLILGSASSMSYREMALCNAAFCYGQIGDGARATTLYEQALREFPDSGLAAASLNMLRSVQPTAATGGA
jgi:tetratricopeptide (TPR) repeat protein